MEEHTKPMPERRSARAWPIALATLVLGFVLGATAFAILSPRNDRELLPDRTIHLTRDEQAGLAANFAEIAGRPPTKAEFGDVIEGWVRDEILYREGLRRGLDDGDPVVRRRLAQKMAAVAAQEADAKRPDEATLRKWLADHPERFADNASATFDQLYFTTRSRAIVARTLLEGGADWRRIGDPASLPAHFEHAGREAIVKEMGDEFARELDVLAPGRGWRGPLEGSLGWHLVRLTARDAGRVPSFATIGARVEADWRADNARNAGNTAYQALRKSYSVRIDQ